MSRLNSNCKLNTYVFRWCTSSHVYGERGAFILLIIHGNVKTAVIKTVLNLKNKKTRLLEYTNM